MRKFLKIILLIAGMLFADSATKDTLDPVPCIPSVTYFPFSSDTITVGDSTSSTWYWINHRDMQGIGSVTVEFDYIGDDSVGVELHRVFTNDTTWDADRWIQLDSLRTQTRTTLICKFYGAKFFKFVLVGFQAFAASDKAECRAKFTIK